MSTQRLQLAVILGILLIYAPAILGQKVAPVMHGLETPAPMIWLEVARQNGLTEEQIGFLEKNGMLITGETFGQIFSAYEPGDIPLFITSDSLLNAYHVLYEASIMQIENKMADRLPDILRLILNNMDDAVGRCGGKQKLAAAARKRALLVTGIALKLLDSTFAFNDAELDEILSDETNRIIEAKEVTFPKWLGRPDRTFQAIDYSRYLPRGFYTRSEKLKRYFRAVSWFQSIPFRIRKDEELLAMLLMGECIAAIKADSNADWKRIDTYYNTYSEFIGEQDDWDLLTAAEFVTQDLKMNLNAKDLKFYRKLLTQKAEQNGSGALINDQIRAPRIGETKGSSLNFRMISAFRTPSAILFDRTTEYGHFHRDYPNGLEVAAALGSVFARHNLNDPQKEELLRTIDRCKQFFNGNSLYFSYLDALRTLVDAPDEHAPGFMQGNAWQAKSCNTVLGGWAQLRHTWVLHAKENVQESGVKIGWTYAGFVEPEPEFFDNMAALADSTLKMLNQTGTNIPDYSSVIAILEKLLERTVGVTTQRDWCSKVYNDSSLDYSSGEMVNWLMQKCYADTDRDQGTFKQKRQWIADLIRDLKSGNMDKRPDERRIIGQKFVDVDPLWGKLRHVCRRLQDISSKQLRHEEFDDNFIRNYQNLIASIMFYEHDSLKYPRNDAPRVVDVYYNPAEHGYLHVGISQPRRIYVLYPWKGESVLCTGAIMPYQEFVNDSRLTDEAWRTMLHSENRPAMPSWFTEAFNDSAVQ